MWEKCCKKFLKHVKCENIFHQSCAKLSKGVKVINNAAINCWSVENGDVNEAFFDALEIVSVDNKVDINIFSCVIKQKDTIMYELYEKIKLLNEQILYLKLNASDIKNKDTITKSVVETKTANFKRADPGNIKTSLNNELYVL